MSCVVAGLRYYFRIYKYEYLGELMTSELHIPVALHTLYQITCSVVFQLYNFTCSVRVN